MMLLAPRRKLAGARGEGGSSNWQQPRHASAAMQKCSGEDDKKQVQDLRCAEIDYPLLTDDTRVHRLRSVHTQPLTLVEVWHFNSQLEVFWGTRGVSVGARRLLSYFMRQVANGSESYTIDKRHTIEGVLLDSQL
ncbi:MAG: hypothetical protein FRX48_00250 [Lasallia pustulata]|uniref:Uncharacterized protein n=1 Tax=Lasallia pustulata TaxID=136370 RepID=A0A5M8Q067_9LECA|nr:MAG: hypothetical protein FRX48_00250 [Lasallia pustulata]